MIADSEFIGFNFWGPQSTKDLIAIKLTFQSTSDACVVQLVMYMSLWIQIATHTILSFLASYKHLSITMEICMVQDMKHPPELCISCCLSLCNLMSLSSLKLLDSSTLYLKAQQCFRKRTRYVFYLVLFWDVLSI